MALIPNKPVCGSSSCKNSPPESAIESNSRERCTSLIVCDGCSHVSAPLQILPLPSSWVPDINRVRTDKSHGSQPRPCAPCVRQKHFSDRAVAHYGQVVTHSVAGRGPVIGPWYPPRSGNSNRKSSFATAGFTIGKTLSWRFFVSMRSKRSGPFSNARCKPRDWPRWTARRRL